MAPAATLVIVGGGGGPVFLGRVAYWACPEGDVFCELLSWFFGDVMDMIAMKNGFPNLHLRTARKSYLAREKQIFKDWAIFARVSFQCSCSR